MLMTGQAVRVCVKNGGQEYGPAECCDACCKRKPSPCCAADGGISSGGSCDVCCSGWAKPALTGGICVGGGSRMGGICMGGICMGGICMGGSCVGGSCVGGSCIGGSCMGGGCVGGTGV